MKQGRAIAIAAGLTAVIVIGSLLLLRHRPVPNNVTVNEPQNFRVQQPHARRRLLRTQALAMPIPDSASSSNNDVWDSMYRLDQAHEVSQLTREEIDAFLTQKNHSADSLVVAFWLTNATNFLYEAAEKYPNDPRVQLVVLERDAFPEDRWRWLGALKQNAPDNALADYLIAREHLKAGQIKEALSELALAASKPEMNSYWRDTQQAAVEAYESAGFSPADAHILGLLVQERPWLRDMRDLGRELASLASQYRERRDDAGANNTIRTGLALGERVATDEANKLFMSENVGNSIQVMLLTNLNPSALVEFGNQKLTAAQRVAGIRARNTIIRDLDSWLTVTLLSPSLTDADVLGYFEHVRNDGEMAAAQWLRDKLGPNPQPQPSASERK